MDIEDLIDMEGGEYEHLWKCGDCDNDSWRYLTNKTLICTSCYMEYQLDEFIEEEE